MPRLQTIHFGTITYRESAVLEFPYGLPAFEQERRFLPIEQPSTAPVIFLQSLSHPELVFITLPVLLVDPAYRLMLSLEDLEALALAIDRQPQIGKDVLCLAIVTVTEHKTPTANLMAPVVVNLKTRCALQAIQAEAGYSHQHPLQPAPREETCS
jgi:flagellar assembly factor FliW